MRNKTISLEMPVICSVLHLISHINAWVEHFLFSRGHPLLRDLRKSSVMTVAIFCLESLAPPKVHGVSLSERGTWKRLLSGQEPWRLLQCLQTCKMLQRSLKKRHVCQVLSKMLHQRKQELQHPSRKLWEHQPLKRSKREQVLDLRVRITKLKSHPALLLKWKLLTPLLLPPRALSKMRARLRSKLYCLNQFN